MKWATIICALLTAIAVWMPAFAAGDEALRSHMLGGFTFNLGPRSLPSLSGLDRHAGDLFTHRNIFQRVYGDAGMDGADISYRFGDATELSAFGAFDARYADPLDDDGFRDPQLRPDRAYGVEMATRASVLDLSIRYAEAREDGPDAGVSPEGVLIPVRWRLVSAGIDAGVGDLGLHAEGGRAWLNAEDGPEGDDLSATYSQFLVGIDYTFENNLYLVLEYFQEDRAGGDGVQTDRPSVLAGDGQPLGRDNYLVGARYPLTDLTSIEFYNIVNDGDASLLVNPWLILSAGDMFSLKLSARIPFAKDDKPLEDAAPAAFGGIQLNF